jgi:hypothetical protein
LLDPQRVGVNAHHIVGSERGIDLCHFPHRPGGDAPLQLGPKRHSVIIF